MIDEGRIVRAGTIADLTDVTSFLRVEVEFGADRLAARLAERGLPGSADAREVEVEVSPERIDQAQELIVETVEGLGLPLIRLEQRRRRLEELFEVAEQVGPTEGAGP